jgi:GTP cyclohydrolase I
VKATVKDVIRAMDELAPSFLKEDWDNSGLQIGHPEWPVAKIMVALDPVLHVVEFACENHVDMLVTHHPLIFEPLRSINASTPGGKIIQTALAHKLAIFSAHTNLDMAKNGTNDILAERIGLKEIGPLMREDQDATHGNASSGYSFGRIGIPDKVLSLWQLAESIKRDLDMESVRVAGPSDLKITKVATCCGSGSGMMELFLSSDAQVFISGDLKYHDARDAEAMGVGLIDIGHFTSEYLMINALARDLNVVLVKQGFDVRISGCNLEKEPFRSC